MFVKSWRLFFDIFQHFIDQIINALFLKIIANVNWNQILIVFMLQFKNYILYTVM